MDPGLLQAQVGALSGDDREALVELLEGNGISEDALVNRNANITELEMFLFNYPRMSCFHLFPSLTTLTLTQQGITRIEGLQGCPALEALWLNENCIERIEGLESCRGLKRLYLFSNRIRRIEHLQHCPLLEVLWLSDNQIVVLEGLDALTHLRELNLARNHIDQIGDTLAPNSNLQSLNLSDNQIGAFKEVCYLARLPKLLDLSFADPHWGECPISGLCNYQTYVLFNLQQLTSLDTLVLPDETKQLAEATYMKKKMYYNMRIKTLRRNTSNAIRQANLGRAAKVAKSVAVFDLLVRQLKDIEAELATSPKASYDAPYASQLQSKAADLTAALSHRTVEIRFAQDDFEARKARVHELSNEYVRRMMVELETGGNIRMEDGKPTDLWYSSCMDLVNSRFFSADFAAFQLRGLKVTRVTRVHNRFLRNRFEERLEGLVDMSDSSYKRSLEYLFFGESPGLPGELLRAAEDGFRHASEYAALGMDGAITLSNSISIADMPRLSAAASSSSSSSSSPLVGQVLVAKVFLGKSAQESALTDKPDAKRPVVSSKADYPDCNSVFRVKQGDQKQRQWYVFDHCLVLPEYLVEFEYEAAPGTRLDSHHGQRTEALSSSGQAALDGLDFDVRNLARPLVPLLLSAGAAELDGHGRPVAGLTGKEAGMAEIKQPPLVPEAPPMIAITASGLQQRLGASMPLEGVTYLNLHGSGIRKIECLEGVPCLRTLVLCFNEIARIEGLSELVLLERLDLSYNDIRRIEGLKGLSALRTLELNNNQLQRLEDVNMLKKYVPELGTLNLASNPICGHKTYRTLLLRRLPGLVELDREEITPEERESSSDNTSTLTVQVIKDNAYSRRSTSIAVSGVSSADAKQGSEEDSWWRNVEELVVEHQRVRRIQNMEKLSSLRRASFADNELTRIEGLDCCSALEELSVEDNRIMAVDGLSRCRALKKLELGKNKISRIEGLEALSALTQLSLEDNDIETLSGISSLHYLMELYIGNNRISQLREVLHVKDLPKLIIVDLLGNPLCQEDDYRLYTVFHLKKLKVLDGSGIEASELTAAKNKYTGRLTMDTMEAKVGHRSFERLRELDISGLRIRDVASCFQTPEFNGLQEVNLDSNLMSDVQGFAHLPSLAVLRLGGNRLGDSARFDSNPYSSTPPFPALQVLQLGQNSISSIERLALGALSALRSLFLQGNDITRVDGLHGLVSLQELVLDRNRIKYVDAGAFAPLRNLRELRIEENGLRSLANAGDLPRLQALHLGYNRIADTSEIDRLSTLTELLEINMVNNPLCRKQVYRAVLLGKVPTLRAIDGREVTPEERDYVATMFQVSGGPAAAPPLEAAQVSNGVKMPLKMTNLNFDQFVGPGVIGAAAGSGDFNLELQGGALGVQGQRATNVPRPSSNDRPGYVIGGRGVGPSGGGSRTGPGVSRPGASSAANRSRGAFPSSSSRR